MFYGSQVLNDETFTILVLMALFTTFITTPTVMAIYKPARGVFDELRLLVCVHDRSNVPSIINIIKSTLSTKKSFLKVFVMQLMDLTERTSSIRMVQRARNFPLFHRFRHGQWYDRLTRAFQAYSQLGRVTVRSTTTISSLSTMHECICRVAEEKKVAMIILPFHIGGDDGTGNREPLENVGHGWRGVIQKLQKNAPCSVAVLVDRGFKNGSKTPGPTPKLAQRICIVFFGGPDDREAIKLGDRMAECPAVKVTIVRFRDGMESHSVMLRPSPRKSGEEYYNFSTAKIDRKKEKVTIK